MIRAMAQKRRKKCPHRFVVFEANFETREVRTRCVACGKFVSWPKAVLQ